MCPRTTDQKWQESRCICTRTCLPFATISFTMKTYFKKNDGCLNFVDENDEVLISGFGRRGKAKGDIPGVRFKVVKVSGVGLLALWKENKVVKNSRTICSCLLSLTVQWLQTSRISLKGRRSPCSTMSEGSKSVI